MNNPELVSPIPTIAAMLKVYPNNKASTITANTTLMYPNGKM